MAANPLPLLALAAAAFYMSKKSKSAPAKTAAETETASPNADTHTGSDGKALMALGTNCQPLTPPTDPAEKEAYAKDMQAFIQKRTAEIYQQFMADQASVLVRLNTDGIPSSALEELVAKYPGDGIQIKDGYILGPIDDWQEIYYAVYLEIVPSSCARKMVWNSGTESWDKPIFPSAAAGCLAAILKNQVGSTLLSITGDSLYSPHADDIAATAAACVGLDAFGG